MMFRYRGQGRHSKRTPYRVIRIFDAERVLVALEPRADGRRQLTLLRISEGKFV